MQVYTASEAAEEIGCHKSTVSRACEKHGIGIESGRQIILLPADIERLKGLIQDKPGNPNCKKDNYFMGAKRRPKKSRK